MKRALSRRIVLYPSARASLFLLATGPRALGPPPVVPPLTREVGRVVASLSPPAQLLSRGRGPGKDVVVWATKDAVRLGLPGEAQGVACNGCPPLERLFQQFADGGGELWLCPICLSARELTDVEKVGNAKVAGATPLWEWAGNDATIFSY